MKPEARFRTELKRHLRKLHPVSIENALTTPGLPDLAIVSGWIELKVVRKWPVRPTTPLRIEHFTPVQKAWARDWTAAGGNYWLVVKVAGEIFVFDAVAAQYVGEITRDEMIHQALAHFEKMPEPDALCAVFSPVHRPNRFRHQPTHM